MRHKFETFDKFKEFKAKVENHRGRSIKSLRSNHGVRVIKFLKPMIASFTDPAHYATFHCAPFPFKYDPV